VLWNGKVEHVSFPLLPEAKFLSAATKQAFLDEVVGIPNPCRNVQCFGIGACYWKHHTDFDLYCPLLFLLCGIHTCVVVLSADFCSLAPPYRFACMELLV